MTVTWPEGDVLGRTAASWEALLTRGVNVQEFGVDPAGLTSANTAWGLAAAYTGAGTLYVPPGTYLFSNQLNFSVANQTIYLARGATLLSGSGGVTNRPFQITANGVSIIGEGSIDGNLSSTPTLTGHVVINAGSGRSDLLLEGITVKNGGTYGINFNNASNVTIRRCKFTNICGQAISNAIGVGHATNNVLIDGNTIDNSTVTAEPGRATIQGTGIGVGALSPPTGLAATNVRIVNNVIICPPAGTSGLGDDSSCVIGQMQDSVIANNTCSGSAISISPIVSNRLAVTGNTCSGPRLYAIELPSVTNVTVTGNSIDGNATSYCGIIVDGTNAQNVTITGNTISNMPAVVTALGIPNGIFVASVNPSNAAIVGNFVEMEYGNGIGNNSGSGVLIAANRCHNSGTAVNGVFSSGAGDVAITDNQMTGAFARPVELYEASPQTRNRLTVIGNNADSAPVVTKSANLTLGTGCRICLNGADANLTTY